MYPNGNAANNRILVIDDNPSIHADFQKILGGAHSGPSDLDQAEAALFGDPAPTTGPVQRQFQLEFASQGEQGLHKVEAALAAGRPFAVAFVDVRMPPGWDGVETISRLWAVDAKLQVVLCTAFSDYSWKEISQRLGESERLLILKKPFDNIEVTQLAHALTHKWLVTAQAEAWMEHLDSMVQERTRELHEANLKLEQAAAESRRLAQLADAANRAKTDFLTVVSHEMLTPMNGVIGLAQYLESTSLDPDQRECVHDVLASGDRMLNMGRQVLDFIDADNTPAPACLAPLDLASLTAEVVLDWTPKAAAKGLTISIQPADSGTPTHAHGDPRRFRRAVAAILDNAVKFTPENAGAIQISFPAPDPAQPQSVRCQIADPGIGIPADRLESLFRPFSQVDGSLAREHEGMGLGLALSRKLLESMGGTIQLASQPGRGTTVLLQLPTPTSNSVNPPLAA